jgi:hypothetical protein
MQVPGPVRAFVGLVAATAEEAKHLPDRAIELPMLAVSTALQMSLRAQQRYARLAARGDEVINRRPATDEPPPWATFDDPVPGDEFRAIGLDDPDPTRRARAASDLLDELLGGAGKNVSRIRPRDDAGGAANATPAERAPKTPAKKTNPSAAKEQPAKKAPSRAASAAKRQPAKRQAAKKPAAKRGSGDKAINPPRHTAPSPFDTVADD